jgi:hypothetical protein
MVSGANKMSLMHWYRQMTEGRTVLQKQLEASEKQNRILLDEVKMLKELLYGIELEYTAKILKK